MSKRYLLLASLVTTLLITGCTDKTQEKAKDTAQSASQDVASAVTKTGEVVQQGASTTVSAVASTGEVLKEGVATANQAAATAVATGAEKVANGAEKVAIQATDSKTAIASASDVPEKQQY